MWILHGRLLRLWYSTFTVYSIYIMLHAREGVAIYFLNQFNESYYLEFNLKSILFDKYFLKFSNIAVIFIT